MGCYPLFACEDWSQLAADLDGLEGALVSAALVTDPFGAYDFAGLQHCFRDIAFPFKEHFVVDLSRPPAKLVSSHHRRCARRALRRVAVEQCADPEKVQEEWVELYTAFAAKRGIRGLAALAPEALARQLAVPGLTMFRASHEGSTVGMHLWFSHGQVGYAHLAAYTDLGHRLTASYALFWSALEHFAVRGLHWLDLGGAAGVGNSAEDGLSAFKRGWSTGTRTAYFCGRILDRAKYREITGPGDAAAAKYFPAYRDGEFA